MQSADVQRNAAAEETATCESLIDTLKHLHSVTLGESFYFNSIKISTSGVLKSCEAYWHQGLPEHSNDEQLELTRVRLLMRFTDLVNVFERRPADRYILFNLRELLQSTLPRTGESRRPHQRQKPTSQFGSSLLDPKIITVAFIATLIKFCLVLQSYDSTNAFCDSIISSIQNQFVRPYCLILWSRARKELRV